MEYFELSPDELAGKLTDAFDVQEKIGEGSYGSVYRATHRRSDAVVAVKQVPVDDNLQDIMQEIKVLTACDSPSIIRLFGHFLEPRNLWIVIEYCAAGSVSDMIKATGRPLAEDHIAVIVHDTLLGLSYLHSHGKIHRDIKAGNILIDDFGRGKLADFGVAGQLTDAATKRNTVIGTPYWMAPEVIQEVGYTTKADVWSLGITCIEMAEGSPPNHKVHPMRAIFMIPTRPPPRLAREDLWSPAFIAFLARCLVKNPDARPTAMDMLEDPFVIDARDHAAVRDLARLTVAERERRRAHVLSMESLAPTEDGETVADTVRGPLDLDAESATMRPAARMHLVIDASRDSAATTEDAATDPTASTTEDDDDDGDDDVRGAGRSRLDDEDDLVYATGTMVIHDSNESLDRYRGAAAMSLADDATIRPYHRPPPPIPAGPPPPGRRSLDRSPSAPPPSTPAYPPPPSHALLPSSSSSSLKLAPPAVPPMPDRADRMDRGAPSRRSPSAPPRRQYSPGASPAPSARSIGSSSRPPSPSPNYVRRPSREWVGMPPSSSSAPNLYAGGGSQQAAHYPPPIPLPSPRLGVRRRSEEPPTGLGGHAAPPVPVRYNPATGDLQYAPSGGSRAPAYPYPASYQQQQPQQPYGYPPPQQQQQQPYYQGQAPSPHSPQHGPPTRSNSSPMLAQGYVPYRVRHASSPHIYQHRPGSPSQYAQPAFPPTGPGAPGPPAMTTQAQLAPGYVFPALLPEDRNVIVFDKRDDSLRNLRTKSTASAAAPPPPLPQGTAPQYHHPGASPAPPALRKSPSAGNLHEYRYQPPPQQQPGAPLPPPPSFPTRQQAASGQSSLDRTGGSSNPNLFPPPRMYGRSSSRERSPGGGGYAGGPTSPLPGPAGYDRGGGGPPSQPLPQPPLLGPGGGMPPPRSVSPAPPGMYASNSGGAGQLPPNGSGVLGTGPVGYHHHGYHPPPQYRGGGGGYPDEP
ncbi:hypothetical protein H9P43_003699 [Blastocladiella emersonii ATCC 22665]|nr:hypothetical protein H9P43_003699 [Blastocladiella emersonii ATCC 22665]